MGATDCNPDWDAYDLGYFWPYGWGYGYRGRYNGFHFGRGGRVDSVGVVDSVGTDHHSGGRNFPTDRAVRMVAAMAADPAPWA